MSIKVALEHRTTYRFGAPTQLYPHVVRLRPAPHTRTPIEAYSLTVTPADHFLNWQQDPFGNYLGRLVFPTPARELEITVGLVADMGVINPLDFFVEDYAEHFPFAYAPELADALRPYLSAPDDVDGSRFHAWLEALPLDTSTPQRTIMFLAALNAAVNRDVAYSVRMEVGVQTPDQTLERRIGSCRDSAWLLVETLRHFGLAARFVSGYLVQLKGDDPSQGGPSEDFTDLHAWAEVYVPGAGWIGMDATSALFAGEGHIPLSATPDPASSAPISGATGPAQVDFSFSNTVRRIHEDPRVTRPYSTVQVEALQRSGEAVDVRLRAAGLELTMGGEPTFVSRNDMISEQWSTAADGPDKRRAANRLAGALAERYAVGGLVQRSQGKWYPGEPLPRWQIGLIWRPDGTPVWTEPDRLADPFDETQASPDASARARALITAIATDLGLPAQTPLPAYEDALVALEAELRRPDGPPPETDPTAPDAALVRELDRDGFDGVGAEPVAWALPIVPAWFGDVWASPQWRTRRGRLVLVPGDSPAGARLPLSSVSWRDPDYAGEPSYLEPDPDLSAQVGRPQAVLVDPVEVPTRTAIVTQARDGFVHVFLPPMEQLERFLEVVELVGRAVATTGTSVVLEGYGPPPDPRITQLLVTPDPGVIEVNLQPTASWTELSELTHTLYDLAVEQRLGTEKFAIDGHHSGTGGGNHLTLGGPTPARSPMLLRPDLLVSMLTWWQRHPSLSYVFSGRFIGPTSQAPRFDEGREENLYEMEIAFAEIETYAASYEPDPAEDPDLPESKKRGLPWVTDRALRHLLTDITGNTHRAEFCIDKLYSPDSPRGRLGLLELRGFEMPPHPDMALVQALLVRALVARFAEEPYSAPLIRWGTALHERFLLPHFAMADLAEVVADLRAHGFEIEESWFAPYGEFRFPRIGFANAGPVRMELRQAIEPWHVLGEEATAGGTARYVDSSTERIQVLVNGFVPGKHLVSCNGVAVPMTPTGTPGEYVAGIRYRAWKPWSSLHPTLDIDAPLHVEVVDRDNRVSLGGATYHVVHPGGRSYDTPPVNAYDAEARRARRFEAMGHTAGEIDVEGLETELLRRTNGGMDYPVTLDLRRRVPSSWGRS